MRGQEGSRGNGLDSSKGLGNQEGWAEWTPSGRLSMGESRKGARGAPGPGPRPTSLPAARLSHLGGGCMSPAATHVCARRG